MKFASKSLFLLAIFALLCSPLKAQNSGQGAPKKEPIPTTSDPIPRSDSDESPAPPVSEGESSSKQSQIDIRPPKDDLAKHPDSDVSDITEMHSFNPHRALKDVEIGEFYMKRKNYRAAEDRFREALTYKPGDAVATYRLAEVLDAQNQYDEALKQYQEYLKIPSSGNFTAAAKKAVARLEQKNTAVGNK